MARKKPVKRPVLIQVTVSPELAKWVRREAKATGLSVASWVRMQILKLADRWAKSSVVLRRSGPKTRA